MHRKLYYNVLRGNEEGRKEGFFIYKTLYSKTKDEMKGDGYFSVEKQLRRKKKRAKGFSIVETLTKERKQVRNNN